jgi:hypothetical protein
MNQKNITHQYKSLLEGKMTKDYFMSNVRRSFPQWVSSVNTFDDAVKILKSKRIIAENIADERPNDDSHSKLVDILLKYVKDPDEAEKYASADPESWPEWLEGELNRDSDYTRYFEDEDWKASGLSEIAENDLSLIIDRLNPYSIKHGIAKELEKEKFVDDEIYQKAKERAVKKLQKDPNAYRESQLANAKEVAKADANLQMTDVKEKNLVDLKQAVKKVKGQTVAKANTKSSTKENKKGKPKGVKEMSTIAKKAPGISKVMDQPGKEKVLENLISNIKTALKEDQHYNYTIGSLVHTPDGPGEVAAIVGGTITVNLQNGNQPKDYQVNVIDKAAEKAERDDHFSKLPSFGSVYEKPEESAPKDKNKYSKLKEFLKKFIKKEATRFSVKGKDSYVSDKDAQSFEDNLKKVGISGYQKTRV